ncbi:MAG: PRD domain-containing protein [Clostridiales bacterium]|nr:PRD domain-containing protein [Clostridiales bacterium]
MQIVKKINNNVALAKDDNGQDVVVFGRGIGFPAMPYTLTDLSRIDRSFYDIQSNHISLADSLPEDIIMLAADVVEMAQLEMDINLNPNLPFTLADHLNFALERVEQGVELSTPLSYDVAHLYPKETEMGRYAVELVRQRRGVELPECEIYNVTLHLIMGELENSNMHFTLLSTQVIAEITAIVEQVLDIKLNTDGFNYSRFVMHIRYLIQRLEASQQEEGVMDESMIRQFQRTNPGIYRCSQKVLSHLEKTRGWVCSPDETLYLCMHIKRVADHNSL